MSSVSNAEYIALKKIIKERGLLDKQPWFFIGVIALKVGMLIASIVILFLVDNLWIQALNAIFMGFVLAQIGFTSHSACHRQIFHKVAWNDAVGIFLGNLLLGLSAEWWTGKHNAHHAHPNHDGMDPDLDVPVVAFTPEQVESRRGIWRWMTKNQAFLFFPLLMLQGYALREVSYRFVLSPESRRRGIEIVMMALNLVWYLTLPIIALGPWAGIGFILISQAFFGVYLGTVFAPNHKGMLIVDDNTQIDFLRLQVLTARNVSGHPITDFWYGGLNYQIEHHLFPSLPMHRLREASEIVKKFCAKHGISYHETSMIQSYREILGYLHEVSAPLRASKAVSASSSTPGA
ncbi:MAG: fatty acid desaturase [Roseiflexus sp.]|nr:fatty acid desaturase [Roseiflexus sp.]